METGLSIELKEEVQVIFYKSMTLLISSILNNIIIYESICTVDSDSTAGWGY